ncbi:Transcription initiation factor TFIID subunit 2 [Entamoeba marina]
MSKNTMEYIKEHGIVLHGNKLQISNISLSEEGEVSYPCNYNQTPGILNNTQPITNQPPTIQIYNQQYTGSIGQIRVQWPDSLVLDSEKKYLLHIKYETTPSSGFYQHNRALFTLNGEYDAASWIPTICSHLQLVNYDMTYHVHEPFVVLASGTPTIPVVTPTDRTFRYSTSKRILPRSYGFYVSDVRLLPIESPLHIGFFCKKVTGTTEPFELTVVAARELPHSETLSFAGLVIVSSELTYLADNADRARHAAYALGRALAAQWIGHFIIANKPPDEWIIVALRDYLAEQYVKFAHGQNYAKFKAIKAQQQVLEKKWGTPLHDATPKTFNDEFDEHFRKKADIAMDRMKMLIIDKVFYEGKDMIDVNRILKTKNFIKELQTQNASLMKQFEERLIEKTGYGKISVSFTFTQRTIQTDFKIKQSKKEGGYNVVPVRIHEVEQTIEDSVELTGEETEKSIPCHSRIRKQRKRRIKTDTGETITYDLDSRDCKRSGQGETDVPILYIEIDPDNDYPRRIKRDKQSFQEYMWLTQLEFVRTVRGQLITIDGLEKCASEKGIQALYNFLINNHRCFYKVQIEAAKAIARMSSDENNYHGFQLLTTFYKENFFIFSNPLRYELQKGLITALSLVRIHQQGTKINWGKGYKVKHNRVSALTLPSKPEAAQLLLEIAENSTNERNSFQDGVFVKTVVKAIGTITSDDKDVNIRVEKYLRRVLNKDKIIPSDRNVVTQAVISVKPSYADLDALAQEGNYFEVRVKAVKAMLRNDPIHGLDTFLTIHERKDKGRVRVALCDMALNLTDFPSQQLKDSLPFKEIGQRMFVLLCDREDYVHDKIKLSFVFKKWWGDSLGEQITF